MGERAGEIISVGVTELHDRTSELMRAVEDGAELEVTDRGKPIARMSPQGPQDPLARDGDIRKATVGRSKLPPPLKLRSGVTVSDLVKEQQLPITPWESDSA
ncbi:MAG: type II toxin-antitoxin system prevent-host-death family antitoxin [Solirubrobacterales bacterium]|nr:type II toxin-antitoxin system prevent-host-death family antitoxin [Solirubrobacterales bacterium]